MSSEVSDKVIEWTRIIPNRVRLCVTLVNDKTGELYDGVYELSRQDNLKEDIGGTSYRKWLDAAIEDAMKGGLAPVGNVERLIDMDPPNLEDRPCADSSLAECRAADAVGRAS